MIQFSMPTKPPTVNSMYVNVKGRGRVKSKRYANWINQAIIDFNLIRSPIIKTLPPSEESYGFIIRLKKAANADYTNYAKPLEDFLVNVGATPDDCRNIFPLVIPHLDKARKDVHITILDSEEAMEMVRIINKFTT